MKKDVRQMYYVLDTKNKLKSLGLFSSEEIQKKFDIKSQSAVYKICERQQVLKGQFILVEYVVRNRQEEKIKFSCHLFHENHRYLYYLTNKFQIIQKSKRSNMQIEISAPAKKIYCIDRNTYNLTNLYKKYFIEN